VRLFVAAYPDQEAVGDLQRLVSTLQVAQPMPPGRSTRLQPPGRWHLTLSFLGDVPDVSASKAAGAITKAWEAVSVEPVLRLAGGGSFGRGRFTVLWVGLRGDVEGLTTLANAVRREIKRAKLPVDPKPYRPHLTIARPGDRLTREQVDADRAALDSYQGPQWTVKELHLVRSYLGPRPTYETVSVTKPATRPTPPDPDHRSRPAGTVRPAG
jgi:2'-5' RNA ligase